MIFVISLNKKDSPSLVCLQEGIPLSTITGIHHSVAEMLHQVSIQLLMHQDEILIVGQN